MLIQVHAANKQGGQQETLANIHTTNKQPLREKDKISSREDVGGQQTMLREGLLGRKQNT